MKLTTTQAQELNVWVKDGDCPQWLEEFATDRWADEIPYGTLTGDTGTMDEWLCDHVDRVVDYFGEYLQGG